MKIKSIEYQNFRNFEKHGKIEFNTDGKITIVYGKNGVGKTTLHQLFQWILYGRVNFNKTTTKKLYNLSAGARILEEQGLKVWGQIEFEHKDEDYLVRRENCFYKQKGGNIINKQDLSEFMVYKKNESNDWKALENPEVVINEVLPIGLSSYFFFDGETMIADLKVSGNESAKTLKNALYSIFDLELYQSALRDIGTLSGNQTVLGKLKTEMSKAEEKAQSEENVKRAIREIRILENKIGRLIDEIKTLTEEKEENNKKIEKISEDIGTNKSKKMLENNRKTLKESIVSNEKEIEAQQMDFGMEIADNFSSLLVSSVAHEAGERIYLEVQEEKERIIPGLSKELLINILLSKNQRCICGNPLCENEKERLEEWKSFFPPASYKSTYDKFCLSARKYAGKYRENRLLGYLERIVEYRSRIRKLNDDIEEIDEQLRNCGNIDELLEERRQLEKRNSDIDKEITNNNQELSTSEHKKKMRERIKDNSTIKDNTIDKYKRQIELIESVKTALTERMRLDTEEYSIALREEIQNLLEEMLTCERRVHLNDDFQLQVMDSFNDESKSEGQFAVVTFAYIGGILKVLKRHEKLSKKEYPLILDGPFSKLDPEQKQNVLNEIPKFAPQVVIFSKDPLENFISADIVGNVWTINSNNEKNNSTIERGNQWK